MKNPLSLEEKIKAPKLLWHDLQGVLSVLYSNTELKIMGENTVLSPDEELRYLEHVGRIIESVELLTREQEVYPRNLDSQYLDNELKSLSKFLIRRNKMVIQYSMQMGIDLPSIDSLIYSSIFNLVKNSSQFTEPGKKDIKVQVSPFSGVVQNVVYLSEDTPKDGSFIKFNVHDNGKGFPKDRPLKDFLQLGASTRGKNSGFGLYYVYLVCKYLKSHLAIDSKPGDTNVTIYHPLNLG